MKMPMPDRRSVRLLAALLGCATLLGGCASWSYRQLALGQAPAQYDRILPAESSRRTSLGLCHLPPRNRDGVQHVIVALLGKDRRIAAKFQVTDLDRGGPLRAARGYRLVGQVDRRALGLEGLDEADVLRALLSDLGDFAGERLPTDAYGWVGGGLVRVLEARGEGETAAGVASGLAAWAERVPVGGSAEVRADEPGVLHIRYTVGDDPAALF